MLWFKKKKEKGPPGHRTHFQKSIDQNQSFFFLAQVNKNDI